MSKNDDSAELKSASKKAGKFLYSSRTLAHRELRVAIRSNFNSAKNIFAAFFGEFRESNSGDYVDYHTLIVSKRLAIINKEGIENTIKNIAEYGFRLCVREIGGEYHGYIITMTPYDIITNYFNDCFLFERNSINASNVLKQLKLTCRYF